MRLALFGGTFDPIHRGHMRLAAAAADAFSIDQVLFAPTGRQPLKTAPPVASFEDRLAMVQLACTPSTPSHPNPQPDQPDPRFAVSALDRPHPDHTPNYTIDLLRRLAHTHPAAELFALAGADSFLSLRSWRAPEDLLAAAQWIVVSRPGSPLTEAGLAPLALTSAQRARIHLLPTLHEDVSASDLRHRLAAGDSCPQLLPPTVSAYIQAHHLYRDASKQ